MEHREKKRVRFPGLQLSPEDKVTLDEKYGNKKHSLRIWRRVRILQLLNEGWRLSNIGKALATYPREVRRVGWRYLRNGLISALTDEPMPKPSKMLDHQQSSAIVAMVCASPPEGFARWTVRLITQEAIKRGIVEKVSRETIRQVLLCHELKPWREKNVVRSKTGQRIH